MFLCVSSEAKNTHQPLQELVVRVCKRVQECCVSSGGFSRSFSLQKKVFVSPKPIPLYATYAFAFATALLTVNVCVCTSGVGRLPDAHKMAYAPPTAHLSQPPIAQLRGFISPRVFFPGARSQGKDSPGCSDAPEVLRRDD